MTVDTAITPDPVALAGMAPSLKATIAGIYRDLAEGCYRLGMDAAAHRCLVNAAALEYGGDSIDWGTP